MRIWKSADGIDWSYHRDKHQWIGTVAAVPDVGDMVRTVGEFRYGYPEAPHWEGWLRRWWAQLPERGFRWLKYEPHRWQRRSRCAH